MTLDGNFWRILPVPPVCFAESLTQNEVPFQNVYQLDAHETSPRRRGVLVQHFLNLLTHFGDVAICVASLPGCHPIELIERVLQSDVWIETQILQKLDLSKASAHVLSIRQIAAIAKPLCSRSFMALPS